MEISKNLREETVSTVSLIKPDVQINVWLDGSGGYFSYISNPDKAIALAEITSDKHELIVMNKEYNNLMKNRYKYKE